MKRLIPCILCLCMLSSCVDISVTREPSVTDTLDTSRSAVSSFDTTESSVVTTIPDTEEEVTTVATEESVISQTEVTSDESIEDNLPEELTVPAFSFPDEFYEELEILFEEYSINRNCDGDEASCTCNPEYEKLDADGNIIIPRDRCISVYYLDIESGYEFSTNNGVHYPVASVVKIPFCNMIYRKITDGEIDPEFEIVYEKRHYFHGTGVVNKGNYGDVYTVSQLLKLAITESDNTAYEMLKDLVSWDEFCDYCRGIGYTHEEDLRKPKQKLCIESASAAGRDMADFLRSDSEYVDTYKYDLTHTKNRMIKSKYTVYRKYGWTGFAFHDVAYVDAPYPYVLVILSNLEGEDKADYNLFAAVTSLVEKYSQQNRNAVTD